METNNAPEMLEAIELSVEDLDDVSGGCGGYWKPEHHHKKNHHKNCYEPKHRPCYEPPKDNCYKPCYEPPKHGCH